jgi:hypothetical protein
MVEILDVERATLLFALDEAQADVHLSSDVPFIQQALEQLNERCALLEQEHELREIKFAALKQSHRLLAEPALNTTECYFFYQATDGQHLYLSPMDIKILKSQYGDYAKFPDEICIKLAAVEETTLNEEVRKRYKYLSHLPISCDVTFAEVDWSDLTANVGRISIEASQASMPSSSPSGFLHPDQLPAVALLTKATLASWRAVIKARVRKRERKQRKEDRDARARPASSPALNAADVSQFRQRPSSPPGVFDFDWLPLPSQSSSTLISTGDSASTSATVSYARATRVPTFEEEHPPLSSSFPPPATPKLPPASPSSTHQPSFAAILNTTANPMQLIQETDSDAKKKGRRKKQIVLMATGGQRKI